MNSSRQEDDIDDFEYADDQDAHYVSYLLPDYEKWDGNAHVKELTSHLSIKVTTICNAMFKDRGNGTVELLRDGVVIHRTQHRWNTPKEYEVFAENADMLWHLLTDYLSLFLIVCGHQAFGIAKELAREYKFPITLQSIDFKDAIHHFSSMSYLNKTEIMIPNVEPEETNVVMSGQHFANGDYRVTDYLAGKIESYEAESFHLPAAHLERHFLKIDRLFVHFLDLAKSIFRYEYIPPAIAKIQDTYNIAYPLVITARKEVRKLKRANIRDWAKRILDDDRFSQFRLDRDLVSRLSGDSSDLSKEDKRIIDDQGASYFAPKDIALEMAARMCGLSKYQYSIRSLRNFQRGKFSMQTRGRRARQNWK